MASFLSDFERQAWLAIARDNLVLRAFGARVNDLCEAALEQTGRELPVEHAVVMLLRDSAEETARDQVEERLAA